jgi:Zn-dependent oligopeptidase
MTKHDEMQKRLKSAIQQAILNEGRTEGTDEINLTNTDVVEALLEVTGLYASIHGFETYSRTDLAFKHALTIMAHIERFQELRSQGNLPFKVIPRAKIN